ncbi:hypothetical protein CEXT_207531, partial [Caerostris extrusa]
TNSCSLQTNPNWIQKFLKVAIEMRLFEAAGSSQEY